MPRRNPVRLLKAEETLSTIAEGVTRIGAAIASGNIEEARRVYDVEEDRIREALRFFDSRAVDIFYRVMRRVFLARRDAREAGRDILRASEAAKEVVETVKDVVDDK